MKNIKYLTIGLVVLLIAEIVWIESRHHSKMQDVTSSNQMEIRDCKLEKVTDADGYVQYKIQLKIMNYGIDDLIPSIEIINHEEEDYLSEYPLDEEYKPSDPNQKKRIPPGRSVECIYYYRDYAESIQVGDTIKFVINDYSGLKAVTYAHLVE